MSPSTSPEPRPGTVLYWADLHLSHRNVIKHSRRPFVRNVPVSPEAPLGLEPDEEAMDRALVGAWRAALDRVDVSLVWTLGDVSLLGIRRLLKRCPDVPRDPARNVLRSGNHDDDLPKRREEYRQVFGVVQGDPDSWQTGCDVVIDRVDDLEVSVMLTHGPQRDMRGCDYQLYGHIHANPLQYPEHYPLSEWSWLLEDERRINVGVDMLAFRPRSLQDLVAFRRVRGPIGRIQSVWPGTPAWSLWPGHEASRRVRNATHDQHDQQDQQDQAAANAAEVVR